MAKKPNQESLNLDPDRPIPEQLEELALAGDERAGKELDKIYGNKKLASSLVSPALQQLKNPSSKAKT